MPLLFTELLLLAEHLLLPLTLGLVVHRQSVEARVVILVRRVLISADVHFLPGSGCSVLVPLAGGDNLEVPLARLRGHSGYIGACSGVVAVRHRDFVNERVLGEVDGL